MDYNILKQGQTTIVYRGSIITKPLSGKGSRGEERYLIGEIGGNLASLMRITYYFELTTEVIYIYILLDVLVCSIAVYFYESCSILAGRVKIQMMSTNLQRYYTLKCLQ